MSHVLSSDASPSWPAPWRASAVLLLAAVAALLLLYRDTATAMVLIWLRSETFAHALVVPPISLWLIWRRRAELARLQPRPMPWLALPLVLLALAWLLGDLVAVNSVTQLALVAMLVLLVPLILGWRVAAAIAFPLGFLFFAVPIGEFMLPQLMELTADFTVAALRLTGIPVYREGQQFIIPSGHWSVVEACSGLRYLIASVMVGTLFGYLNYRSLKRRLVFAVVAIVLPLVANWVRAYLIVMLGHLSGNRLATGADHLIYGWVFFGAIMLAMFMIGARWSEPDDPAPGGETGVAAVASPSVQRSAVAAVLALAALLAPHLLLQALGPLPGSVPVLHAPVPAGWTPLGAGQADETAAASWQPSYHKPAAELLQHYRQGGRWAGLHLAYYRAQDYDSKLVNSENQLVRSDDPHWARAESGVQALSLQGQDFVARSQLLRPAVLDGEQGRRLLAWQFYWVNGRLTASDIQAKIWGALYRLIGRGDDAAAVVVFTDNGPQAQASLREFLDALWPVLARELEAQREAARGAASPQQTSIQKGSKE